MQCRSDNSKSKLKKKRNARQIEKLIFVHIAKVFVNKADIINRSERDERILVRKSPLAKNAHSASEDDGGRLLTAPRTFSIQAGHTLMLSKMLIFFLICFRIPAWDEKVF